MKTSILYGSHTAPQRACLPEESPDGKRVPHYCNAHVATIGTLFSAKTRQEWQPPRLSFSGYMFDLTPGGTVKPWTREGRFLDARIIPTDYVEKLDAIDQQIIALENQRRELILEAWPHGKRVNANRFKKEPAAAQVA